MEQACPPAGKARGHASLPNMRTGLKRT